MQTLYNTVCKETRIHSIIVKYIVKIRAWASTILYRRCYIEYCCVRPENRVVGLLHDVSTNNMILCIYYNIILYCGMWLCIVCCGIKSSVDNTYDDKAVQI